MEEKNLKISKGRTKKWKWNEKFENEEIICLAIVISRLTWQATCKQTIFLHFGCICCVLNECTELWTKNNKNSSNKWNICVMCRKCSFMPNNRRPREKKKWRRWRWKRAEMKERKINMILEKVVEVGVQSNATKQELKLFALQMPYVVLPHKSQTD